MLVKVAKDVNNQKQFHARNEFLKIVSDTCRTLSAGVDLNIFFKHAEIP